jgi:phosphoenolpyruvate carboxykinase (GTP)
MLPFAGYNMGDYFAHWLAVGRRLTQPPKIFTVNWFRKDADGAFAWPGFRDNSRVLKWMVDRIKGRVGARSTPIGLLPDLQDLEMKGLSLPPGRLESLFSLERGEWEKELAEVEEFYGRFGGRIPQALRGQMEKLKAGVAGL